MQLQQARAQGGEGFRLLTGRTTSPTLLRQIDGLLQAFPKAVWHAYDPIDLEGARADRCLRSTDRCRFCRGWNTAGSWSRWMPIPSVTDRTSYGTPGGSRPDVRHPEISSPGSIVSSSSPGLTGAKADHRLAMHPNAINEIAIAIAKTLGAPVRDAVLVDAARPVVTKAIADLTAHRGAALVLGGPALSPAGYALVHWINAQLQAPIHLIEPVDRTPAGLSACTLAELATPRRWKGRATRYHRSQPGLRCAGRSGICSECAQGRIPAARRLLRRRDGWLATWHVPLSHPLETWSDARASDGTASLFSH